MEPWWGGGAPRSTPPHPWSPQPDPVYPYTAISRNRNIGHQGDPSTPPGGRPGDWTPSGPAGPLRSYVKWCVRAGDGAPRGPTPGPLQRNVCVRPRSGEPAPSGPQLGALMRSLEPPVRAGDQAPREPTLGALWHSAVVRLRPGDPAPSGPPLGPLRRPVERKGPRQEKEPPKKAGWAEPRTTAGSWCSVNHPGHNAEQGTWGSRTRKHREAGCGRPEDGGVWTAQTVKRPPQQPAKPQYANYWAPLTRKRHIPPHPAQPRHTNYWAPRTRKRHQQEHWPQRPTERSDPTQHAKGRTADCQGPRKETTTRRNVPQGGLKEPFLFFCSFRRVLSPPPPSLPGAPSCPPPTAVCAPTTAHRRAVTAPSPFAGRRSQIAEAMRVAPSRTPPVAMIALRSVGRHRSGPEVAPSDRAR